MSILRSLLFLGFIVPANGIFVDPEKVRAIKEWPMSRTLTEFDVFMDLSLFIDGLLRDLVLS